MKQPSYEYDCSEIEPNIESIRQLNTVFQKQSYPELKFQIEQEGQSHASIFHTTTLFEGWKLYAQGRTKKETEKKIKTYIWYLISEDLIYFEDQPRKQIKTNPSPKSQIYTPFLNFKDALMKEKNPCRPVLILDLENCGNKSVNNHKFKEICSQYDIRVIAMATRHIPEHNPEILFIKRDNLHRDSADEGIRRLIYFLVDHLEFTKIGLVTMDHFGQNLKDVFAETNESFLLFTDVDDFILKHQQLVKITGATSISIIKQSFIPQNVEIWEKERKEEVETMPVSQSERALNRLLASQEGNSEKNEEHKEEEEKNGQNEEQKHF